MEGIYTQRRPLKLGTGLSRQVYLNGPVKTRVIDFSGTQVTTSYRSDGSPTELDLKSTSRVQKASLRDVGHEFLTQKRYRARSRTVYTLKGVNGTSYEGPLMPFSSLNGDNPKFADPSSFNMGYYGPAAIAKTDPLKARAEVLTAVIELVRDGLPSGILSGSFKAANSVTGKLTRQGDIKGALKDAGEGLGSDFLNYTFGVLPLIRDIESTITTLQQANKLLFQLSKDAGHSVRRSLKFPVVRDSQTFPNSGPSSAISLFDQIVGGTHSRVFNPGTSHSRQLISSERVWFSGRYSYRLPIPGNLLDTMVYYEAQINALLGTRPTPARLWEVVPFSWLIDWFVNVQSALQAAEAFHREGFVLEYGYLMRHTVRRDVLTATVPLRVSGTPITSKVSFVTETKARFRASPFGFGLVPGSFTSKQWAILAALGLSRGNRTVWSD